MNLIFTKHAKKRMFERGIKEKDIKETIDFPEYIIKRGKEIEAYKRINNQTLKVVYVGKGEFKNIITLYYLQ